MLPPNGILATKLYKTCDFAKPQKIIRRCGVWCGPTLTRDMKTWHGDPFMADAILYDTVRMLEVLAINSRGRRDDL